MSDKTDSKDLSLVEQEELLQRGLPSWLIVWLVGAGVMGIIGAILFR